VQHTDSYRSGSARRTCSIRAKKDGCTGCQMETPGEML
jgi:hypothetical protein